MKILFKSFNTLKRKGLLNKNIVWELFKKFWWLALILVVIVIFHKQIDWSQIKDLRYWAEKKLNIPFKNEIEPSKEVKKKKSEITLLYLFEHDFGDRLLRSSRDEIFRFAKNGSEIKIKSNTYFDFEAQTKFIGFYIPSDPRTFEICINLVDHYNDVFRQDAGIAVETEGPHLQPVQKSELKFSGRVFIYHEYPLLADQKRRLFDLYKDHGLSIQFRGSDYLWKMKELVKT